MQQEEINLFMENLIILPMLQQKYKLNELLKDNKIRNHFMQNFKFIEWIKNNKDNIEYDHIETIYEENEFGKIKIIKKYRSHNMLAVEEHYLNDKKHRKDSPAIIKYNIFGEISNEKYYINGELHRENGPAVIQYDGYIEYFLNGKRHRDNGAQYIQFNCYEKNNFT